MTDYKKFSQPDQPWPFDPRVKDLLEHFLRAAKKTKKPYAIGGALAMAAHGYIRQTRDVDAFLVPKDHGAWARALREEGLQISPLMTAIHYVAVDPEHDDAEIRIDLLYPSDDPDWSAVQFPETGSVAGIEAEVFPVTLLVAAKFQSTRESDHADVDAMHKRGLFDVAAVVGLFQQMGDDELAEAFEEKYG